MAFSNPIVAGTELVRKAIQSPNYVTGVSGWSINRDGTAEFSNIIARGEITASELDVIENGGDRGRIHAYFDALNLEPKIELFIGEQNILDNWGQPETESAPAEVVADISTVTGAPRLRLTSGRINNRGSSSVSISGDNADVSDTSSINFAADNYFFATPGGIESSIMRDSFVDTTTDINETSTTFVETDTLMRVTFTAPPSGIITVHFGFRGSNNTDSQNCQMSYEIRQDNVAGTLLIAASSERVAIIKKAAGTTGVMTAYASIPHDGLSGTIFIRAMYSTSGVSTATFNNRYMTVHKSP